MQKKMIVYKNVVFKISYILGTLILILLTTDFIYVRCFERIPPLLGEVYLQMTNTSVHQRADIEGLFYELRPNAQAAGIKINSFGMRDHEPHIKKDAYRVLVMGDSVTFALDLEQNQPFTEVVERILNNEAKKVEIINAGVCGYNTKQEFIALKEKYLDLKPDMVIFAYCVNDTQQAAIQYLPNTDYLQKQLSKVGKKPQKSYFTNLSKIQYLAFVFPKQVSINYNLDRWLLLHSGIYRAISISKFKAKYKIKDINDLPYFLLNFDFNAILAQIKAISQERGFLLRFVILPTLLQWNRDYVVQKFLNNGIVFWDLDTEIKKKYGSISQMMLVGNLHFNEVGNLAVGQLLAEKIRSELH